MDQTPPHPFAYENYIVFFALACTWPIYLIGGLYVLGPVLGVCLTALVVVRAYCAGTSLGSHSVSSPPMGIWVWIAGMLAMLLALEIAHVAQGLSLGQTIKSTIGWAKGWALFALFPLAGACLHIRLETVIRAARWVAAGTLLITPILVAAPVIGLPQVLYVSPLRIVGGPGPEFFAVQFYSIEPTDGSSRWRFFTPWSPAAGLIGNIFLILALNDKRCAWQIIGSMAALTMIILSKSRLALAAALAIWPIVLILRESRRPLLWFAGMVCILIATPLLPTLLDIADTTLTSVKSMRADSTRVRETLGEIALDRWWTEAPIWGHGIVERGPHIVENMPIGSHHTWYGLLFVKGAVGALALAIPLLWSLIELAILTATRSRAGQIGFAMVLLMTLYTIGENLEILTYLMWPALIIIGIAMKEASNLAAS